MMKPSTQSKLQMFGAWSSVIYVVLLIVGWAFLAGFFPPHLPSADAATIAQIFINNPTGIRMGMVMIMFAALAVIPLCAVFSYFMAQIEGGAKMLTFMSLLGSAALMVLTFYPAIFWLVAAYRPERPAELVLLMNDLSWLQLLGGVSIFYALPISAIVAAFSDDSPTPVFPRWSGYYNLWSIVVILPDQLMFFFHVGPFAWNGLFGFWFPLSGFGSWFFVIGFLLRKAVLRERQLLA